MMSQHKWGSVGLMLATSFLALFVLLPALAVSSELQPAPTPSRPDTTWELTYSWEGMRTRTATITFHETGWFDCWEYWNGRWEHSRGVWYWEAPRQFAFRFCPAGRVPAWSCVYRSTLALVDGFSGVQEGPNPSNPLHC